MVILVPDLFSETPVFWAPVAATFFEADFTVDDFTEFFELSDVDFPVAVAFAPPAVATVFRFVVVSRDVGVFVAVTLLFDFELFLEDDIHEYSSAARCGDGPLRRQAKRLRPDGRVT